MEDKPQHAGAEPPAAARLSQDDHLAAQSLEKSLGYPAKEKPINDEESGNTNHYGEQEEIHGTKRKVKNLIRRYMPVIHFLIWTLWTV